MRLSLRFILPLLVVLAWIAWAVVPLIDQQTLRWFVRDMDMRAELVARTIAEPLTEQLANGRNDKAGDFFNQITQDRRLFAIGYCSSSSASILASQSLPAEIKCSNLERWQGANDHMLANAQGPLLVSVKPMVSHVDPNAQLVVVHDMSFITQRSEETQRYVFYAFLLLGAVISLVTVVIAQLSWRGWMSGVRALMRGDGLVRKPEVGPQAAPPGFQPIARDLQRLIRDLESESRSRDESQVNWSPESLRTILHTELRGDDVIVVSNREPYIHQRSDKGIEVQQPASGLVTALEPIMRACSGTWIAHGSGSADRDVVDKHDRVAVPPDDPAYMIRRVWLSEKEVAGYYNGFANEGLWPLCHIAHTRPTFRSSDWEQYVAVNRKFANAVFDEAKTDDPIVFVQDYHLALLPKMIREKLPNATIITFWHIPWSNPESFAICPWREEILAGMLGSSIMGFHTQFHCNNFVDTVDRFLEARVDRESFNVSYGGKQTAVRRYPISIAWPPNAKLLTKSVANCRASIRQLNGLPPEHKVGVGVDRLDYTKGILERFRAVERLLELNPDWIGRFSFIQVAAPTRSSVDEYRQHEAEVRATAARINKRFDQQGPPPILLKIDHHEPAQVYEYFRGSDLCFVSSLHDGMNLVAKEFVAARDDEQGVLILSEFTGAARELSEALIVNPYDSDQCAAALHVALTMTETEQRDRMRLMRRVIAEFNVFRWAGRMLLDAAAMRRRERLTEKSGA